MRLHRAQDGLERVALEEAVLLVGDEDAAQVALLDTDLLLITGSDQIKRTANSFFNRLKCLSSVTMGIPNRMAVAAIKASASFSR